MPAFVLTMLNLLLPVLQQVWKGIKAFAGVVIPIPLVLILAAGGWLYLDRQSAVRKAVTSAVAELVAGSELAAKDAVITAQQLRLSAQEAFNERISAQMDLEQQAKDEFEQNYDEAVRKNRELAEQVLRSEANRTKDLGNGKDNGCNAISDELFNSLRDNLKLGR